MFPIPPRSPYGLIQEDLFPDEWKMLVACIMLNCTSRKQIEKVLPVFFQKWPTAKDLLSEDPAKISETIATLGFKNRRTQNIINMSKKYATQKWSSPRELPGIGEYAGRAWEIFFKNDLGDVAPNDGALTLYWKWRKLHDGQTKSLSRKA
jgi:methyl-CpG-binding domain protein 4